MTTQSAATFFENYVKMPRKVPAGIWIAARFLTLAASLVVIAGLFLSPVVSLKIFWGLIIPSLPALLVIAPGLWRQVCPMAFINQIPRTFGVGLGKTLPAALRNFAFSVALASFVGAVALRAPVLNRNAFVLAICLSVCLTLPFIGGLVFKGRSGWCGTFCPLGPIQRVYGQAPVVVVRNGYCPTCLGCQKICYDFNPRGAVFSDIYDNDPQYTGQRRFFVGLLPGLILGYFLQSQTPSYGYLVHSGILLAACATSVGVHNVILYFFGLSPYKTVALFAGTALTLFYAFALPNMARVICDLTGVAVPAIVFDTIGFVGFGFAIVLLLSGLRSERQYKKAVAHADRPSVDQSRKSLKDRLAEKASAQIEDKDTNSVIVARPDQTLLEAYEAAGIKINFGCRSGFCGADALVVTEGEEHLSPPGEDELATLRRLGLEGRARLACVCQTKGPIVVDRDLKAAAARTPAIAKPVIDHAEEAGVHRVVIVGNGVAGISTAEALRRLSPSVQIDVVTDETLHFYNRMALGRVIYGRAGMDGLHLLPDSWYGDNKVEVWRNTLAVSIDRTGRKLKLGTGETLPYDRLVLATGGRAASPDPSYARFANAFVLRTAVDAQNIRRLIQDRGMRSALVIGGGVLGVEAADALHHLGLAVTILHRNDWLMERQLDHEGARRLANYLHDTGINVVTKARIKTFEGDTDLREVVLESGDVLAADLFVACAGLQANIGLAKAADLTTGRGIKVDAAMRTSDENIFAVGDVAELPGMAGGLWPIAGLHAAVAAASIFGQAKTYEQPRLIVQLKCDGIDLRSYGDIEVKEGRETITADSDGNAWWRIVIEGDDVVGGVYVGPPGSAKAITKLFQSGGHKQDFLSVLKVAAPRELVEPA